MRRFTNGHGRPGFTLIELLVVMAIIAALAAMTLVFAPKLRDNTAVAANTVQTALQIARAKAAKDGMPRGVRLIVNPGNTHATEIQFIESPYAFVPNQFGPASPQYVQFNYTLDGPGVTGQIVNRSCTVTGVADLSSVDVGTVMVLPTLGTTHRILRRAGGTLTLDSYPDMQLGGQTAWRTYHFGFYAPPRGLLGEPTVQLPRDTGIDLSAGMSIPQGAVGTDYDILFAPNGNLIYTLATQGVGQVFLGVRDPGKPNSLQQGGEQVVVGIKAKGGIGAAPVDWGADRFSFARKSVSGQ